SPGGAPPAGGSPGAAGALFSPAGRVGGGASDDGFGAGSEDGFASGAAAASPRERGACPSGKPPEGGWASDTGAASPGPFTGLSSGQAGRSRPALSRPAPSRPAPFRPAAPSAGPAPASSVTESSRGGGYFRAIAVPPSLKSPPPGSGE